MDVSVIGYDWDEDIDGGLRVNGNDPEAKVIVDMPELESAGASEARTTRGRADEPRSALARGTRDRVQAPHGTARSQPPRALERDPVAVLRAWPHSKSGRNELEERTRTSPPSPPSRSQRRVEDKIVLAHLALDLFREIDQLQDLVQATNCAEPSEPACGDPRCAARTDVLRAALVEACLLVQRVAMTPTHRADIEDRIHELLQLLQR